MIIALLAKVFTGVATSAGSTDIFGLAYALHVGRMKELGTVTASLESGILKSKSGGI